MKKLKLFCIAIMMAICCFAFVGCGESYDDFSLTFSTSKIEMSVNDKDVTYRLKINNYFEFEPHFEFDFTEKIAKVDKITYLNSGVFEIVMNPLKGGQTNLTIHLLEGEESIIIPVG